MLANFATGEIKPKGEAII